MRQGGWKSSAGKFARSPRSWGGIGKWDLGKNETKYTPQKTQKSTTAGAVLGSFAPGRRLKGGRPEKKTQSGKVSTTIRDWDL